MEIPASANSVAAIGKQERSRAWSPFIGRNGRPLLTSGVHGIAAEPMTIHSVAVSKDGTLHEVGDRTLPGKESVSVFDTQSHSERIEKVL